MSREEIALICIAALESPYALDKTFEVIVFYTFSTDIFMFKAFPSLSLGKLQKWS